MARPLGRAACGSVRDGDPAGDQRQGDHHAYQLLVEALRETPFWDRYFDVVEILVGVENAYADNYGVDTHATIDG